MTENERAQIRLVVSPAMKDEWDDFVAENPEYSNRSDLIRTAVSREMAGRHTSNNGPQTDELRKEIGGMADSMNDLVDELKAVKDRIEQLEMDVGQSPPELDDLSGDVYSLLPTESEVDGFEINSIDPEDGERLTEILEGDEPLDDSHEWMAESGRPDVLSRILQVPEIRVVDALEKLDDRTGYVHSKQRDGRTVYYREQ